MGIEGPNKPVKGQKSQIADKSKSSPNKPAILNSPQFLRVRNTDPANAGQRLLAFQGQEREQNSNQEFVNEARGRLGDPNLDADTMRGLNSSLLAEHLMILLANKRARQKRTQVLAEIGDLILGLNQKERINKILALMPQVGRIVDIYPLEILAYLLEQAPEIMSKHEFRHFVRNRDELLASRFDVGEPIELRVPVALKMRGFALSGGGNPGYAFAPGPPGVYWLEFGGVGSFELLLRGEMRRVSYIDRLTLHIHDMGDKRST